MAREYGKILTSIWSDEDFCALDSACQRLYVLIVTQPQLNMCGVLTPAPSRWAQMAPDTTLRGVKASLGTLSTERYIVQDGDTDELWVRTLVHHDLRLKIPNVWVGMSNAWAQTASTSIRDQFLIELRKAFPKGPPDVLTEETSERLAKGFLKGFLNV